MRTRRFCLPSQLQPTQLEEQSDAVCVHDRICIDKPTYLQKFVLFSVTDSRFQCNLRSAASLCNDGKDAIVASRDLQLHNPHCHKLIDESHAPLIVNHDGEQT